MTILLFFLNLTSYAVCHVALTSNQLQLLIYIGHAMLNFKVFILYEKKTQAGSNKRTNLFSLKVDVL